LRTNRHDAVLLGCILALSVFLRVGVAFYLGDIVDSPPLLTDQRSYDSLGRALIAGRGFSFDRAAYPFTPPNTPTAHWSFLQSLYVAGVYAVFGVHPLAARLVTAVLGGVLLPWVVYRLARRVFSGGTINNSRHGSSRRLGTFTIE
jgi:4-amino-4-deoxy-L-arabinose transferase-like glycosyltransferase